MKQFGGGAAAASAGGRGNLVRVQVTDKNGKQTHVWVSPEDAKKMQQNKQPDAVPQAKSKKLTIETLPKEKVDTAIEIGKKKLEEAKQEGDKKKENHIQKILVKLGGGKKDATEGSEKKEGEVSDDAKAEDKIVMDLKKLAKKSNEARKEGKKAPDFNLCQISIPNTNLFCGGNKGIPRQNMPQLKGQAVEGTPAYKKDPKGEVSGEEEFAASLKKKGVKMTEKQIPAEQLKATQNELVGAKVAGMMEALEKDPKHKGITAPILVSRDGYVLDGHHRWAAMVASKMNTGEPPKMDVIEVDMPIEELVDYTNKFTEEFGIAQKAADANNEGKKVEGVNDKGWKTYLDGMEKSFVKKFQRTPDKKGDSVQFANKKELETMLTEGTYGIVSAGVNPNSEEDKKLTDAQIMERHSNLRKDLVDLGFKYVNQDGKYGDEESSFLVMVSDTNQDIITQLGEKYNQDSVMFCSKGTNRYVFTTGENKGKYHEGKGHQMLDKDEGDFWSQVSYEGGEKERYRLNIDFSKFYDDIKKAIKGIILITRKKWQSK